MLLNFVIGGAQGLSISLFSLESDRTVRPLIDTPFDDRRPALSHDGRWMAYQSNEAGRFEIYVLPYPDVGAGRWQISIDGGVSPVWAHDGTELIYRNGDAMMRVAVETDPAFVQGVPEVLFEGAYYYGTGRSYDVAPDGRFLMLKAGAEGDAPPPSTQIEVVVNWFEELKARVPVTC